MANEIDPSGVQVQQPTSSPVDVSIGDFHSQGFSALSTSLAETSPELHDFLGQVATQGQARAQAKASADARANSGEAFADAVRSGKLEPTQSYWYMRAYAQESAAVRGQSAVTKLVGDSQTWAERSDPVAYQARFEKELGQIQQGFTSPDQAHGFALTALPIANQALAVNEAEGVQRINQERLQNTTSLTTQAVMDAYKANPNATPQQIFTAMEPWRDRWVGTGGTDTQWRLIAKQAVVGAAANLGQASLVDVLKSPYRGGMAIADQADETGKPMGLELSSDKFWIDRGVDATLMQDYKARQAAIGSEGAKLDDWANQKFGLDYGNGKVPASTLREQAEAIDPNTGKPMFSPDAVNWALAHQGEALRQAAGYSTAQTDVYSSDPLVQQRILQVNQEATSSGLTPHLSNELTDMVGRQQITTQMALSIMDRAQGQTHFNIGEASANRREAESLKRTDLSIKLQTYSLVGQAGKEEAAKGVQLLTNAGIPFQSLSTKDQKRLSQAAEDAAMASASKGPAEAGNAAAAAIQPLIVDILKRKRAMVPTPGSRSALANPNTQGPTQ